MEKDKSHARPRRHELNMKDLEKAKKYLCRRNLTLVIMKEGETIFESTCRGISGFLEAIERHGDCLRGSSLADRIAGRAVALLSVYVDAKAIYATILSRRGKEILDRHLVYYEHARLVDSIMDSERTELCPFEKLVEKVLDPVEAYEKLKELYESLSRRKQRC